MRILVDVTHPVHVHLFKNMIWALQAGGHEVLVTACEKDVTIELLRCYGIDYICTGSYGRTTIQKALSVPRMDWELLRVARRFQPDVLVGEAPVRTSHVAQLLRKPCIGLDDTEHAKLQRWLWLPFVTEVLTPSCYSLNLGRRQRRYNGYKELAYLHPKYFAPDADVLTAHGLAADEQFAFVRFVSWEAAHDVGQGGFSNLGKVELVQQLLQRGRVLVSSECTLGPELAAYAFKAPPHLMHHFLYYASVCVTEGATVASECAVLGTPCVYVNTLGGGTLAEQQERYGLVLRFRNRHDAAAIAAAVEAMEQDETKRQQRRDRSARLVQDHVDLTDLLVETVRSAANCVSGH